MWKIDFVRALQAAHVPDAEAEAETFLRDNPGVEDELTPQRAAEEWLEALEEVATWADPARYGAS